MLAGRDNAEFRGEVAAGEWGRPRDVKSEGQRLTRLDFHLIITGHTDQGKVKSPEAVCALSGMQCPSGNRRIEGQTGDIRSGVEVNRGKVIALLG